MSASPPVSRHITLVLALMAAIAALNIAALGLHVPGSIWVGTLARKNTLIAMVGVSIALYFGLISIFLRDRAARWPRAVFAGMLAAGLLPRIAMLTAPPFMSSDIYRYVWDGRVQAAGINPYLYIPADPKLADLRDAAVYPRINRAEYAHTIYPPAAQIIFAAAARVLPGVGGMKLMMALFEAAGLAAIMALLRQCRLPPIWVAIPLLNPLAMWAVTLDGHIDGAAIGLLGLAMLAAARGGRAVTGLLLGAAALTKFLPILAAPALWRRGDWRAPAAGLALIAALYALYSQAGLAVLGFLPNYTHEEDLVQGSGFWPLSALAHVTTLPGWASAAWIIAWAGVIIALALWLGFAAPGLATRGETIARGTSLMLGAGLLALTPHYAWYFPVLTLPAALWPRASTIWLGSASFLLYADPWHDQLAIQSAVFLPAYVLLLRDLRAAHAARSTLKVDHAQRSHA